VKLHVIACNVLNRELSFIGSDCTSILHVHYLEQGLHDRPETLREQIQALIDQIDAGPIINYENTAFARDTSDAIVLAYGLCSNALCGIRSKRYRIVAPRAHDCITLILGSRVRYQKYFDEHPGTYWYTPGWIEQTPMPGKQRVEALRYEYTKRYGEENADYLMDMEQEWLRSYSRCTYVSWPELDRPAYRELTRDSAEYLEWEADEVSGTPDLMRRILNGEWDPDEVLVVEPGDTIAPSYTDTIIERVE